VLLWWRAALAAYRSGGVPLRKDLPRGLRGELRGGLRAQRAARCLPGAHSLSHVARNQKDRLSSRLDVTSLSSQSSLASSAERSSRTCTDAATPARVERGGGEAGATHGDDVLEYQGETLKNLSSAKDLEVGNVPLVRRPAL
jgi:hypothetical protein